MSNVSCYFYNNSTSFFPVNISFVKDPEVYGASSMQTVQELEDAAGLFRATKFGGVGSFTAVRGEIEKGRAQKREKRDTGRKRFRMYGKGLSANGFQCMSSFVGLFNGPLFFSFSISFPHLAPFSSPFPQPIPLQYCSGNAFI